MSAMVYERVIAVGVFGGSYYLFFTFLLLGVSFPPSLPPPPHTPELTLFPVEHHNFWNIARGVLDPHNAFAHFGWLQHPAPAPVPQHSSSAAAPLPVRISPYRHFRSLLHVSCLPCRIDAPKTSHGLGEARCFIDTPRRGRIAVCCEHAWSATRTVKYAQDDLACAEQARKGARWMNAGDAVRVAEEAVKGAAGMRGPGEGVGVNEDCHKRE
ncbi:hypothetical protein B0H11DRAFT_2275305 [Mycena galericulata]|nr:hypothetical protein B0H11DRAFT_2275305 [Mycena galericulata]